MTGKLNRSPEGLAEAFREHIVYEINMLRHAYQRASIGSGHTFDDNAFIETFCLHARILIEFFEGTQSAADDTMAATHFAASAYTPFPSGGVSKRLVGKLNAQIAHLSYGRTGKLSGKISAAERQEIFDALEREVANWHSHLKPSYAVPSPPTQMATIALSRGHAGTTTNASQSYQIGPTLARKPPTSE